MRAPASTTTIASVAPVPAEDASVAPVEPAADQPTTRKRSGRRKPSAPTKHCIPRVAFRRLIRELVAENKSDMRLQQDAVDALQEAAETLVAERFQKCSQLAGLCNLDTVRADHWNYVRDSETVVPVQ